MEASLTESRRLQVPILVKARSFPIEVKVIQQPSKSSMLLDKIF